MSVDVHCAVSPVRCPEKLAHPSVVELTIEAGAADEAFAVDFTVAHVGSASNELERWLGPAMEGERRLLLDPGGQFDDLNAGTIGWDSLYEVLSALLNQPRSDGVAQALVFVFTHIEESPEALLTLADQLAQVGWGVDLIALNPAADLRLLNQVATVARGELLLAAPRLPERLSARLRTLRNQAFIEASLEISILPGIELGSFYCFQPAPTRLGLPLLDEGEHRVIIDIAPLGADQHRSWIFDLQVPARSTGTYLIAEATLRYRTKGGLLQKHVQVIEHVHAGEQVIDAGCVTRRDQAEVIAQLDEIEFAFQREDGRGVAMGLGDLVRQLLTFGEQSAADLAYELRLSFLRLGAIDRVAFNQLRRAAIAAFSD